MTAIPNIPDLERTPFTNFEGTARDGFVVMLYLAQKYPKTCVLLSEVLRSLEAQRPNRPWKNKSAVGWKANQPTHRVQDLIDWQTTSIVWADGYLTLPHDTVAIFKRGIRRCGYRFVLVPLILVGQHNRNLLHANFVIIDTRKHIVERFEPYGITPKSYNNSTGALDAAMMDFATTMLGPAASYTTPDPRTQAGIQTQQELERHVIRENDPVGFCVAFSAMYADFRMACPLRPAEDIPAIMLAVMRDQRDHLTDYIRDFSMHIRQMDEILLRNGKEMDYAFAEEVLKLRNGKHQRAV